MSIPIYVRSIRENFENSNRKYFDSLLPFCILEPEYNSKYLFYLKSFICEFKFVLNSKLHNSIAY